MRAFFLGSLSQWLSTFFYFSSSFAIAGASVVIGELVCLVLLGIGPYTIAQVDLKHTISQPLHLGCLDYRHESSLMFFPVSDRRQHG